MSTTSATQIEQSVSAQQLTASDEQALYHLHQQYNEQHHELLQLQDPTAAILHAATAAGGHESPPSHNQQNSISQSPISGVSDSGGVNSAKDGKRNGHGRLPLFLIIHCIML